MKTNKMKKKFILGGLLAAVIAASSFIVYAIPQNLFDTPAITSGNVVENAYYNGAIDIGVNFNDPALGHRKKATYSIDGGTTWHTAEKTNRRGEKRLSSLSNGNFSDHMNSTVLTNGNVVTAWAEHPTSGSTVLSHIKFQRFTSWGKKLGSAIQVSKPPNFLLHSHVQVGSLNNGGFIIAWNALNLFEGAIYAQRFDQNGKAIGGRMLINDSEGEQSKPVVTALPNGFFAILWIDKPTYNSSSTEIYAQVYKPNGAKHGAKFRVNRIDPKERSSQKITAMLDGSSDFATTWTSRNQDGDHNGIYARILQKNGQQRTNEFRVNSTTAGNQAHSNIVALSNGNIVVVWKQTNGIRGRIFSNRGDIESPEFSINTASTPMRYGAPGITSFADSSFLVSWSRIENGKERIFGRKFKANRQAITGEFIIDDFSDNHKRHPKLVATSENAFMVTYEVSDNPTSELRYRFYRPYLRLTKANLNPAQDIGIRFRLKDQDTKEFFHSETRNYYYDDPNALASGQIVYTGGYTNQNSRLIELILPPSVQIKSSQIYERIGTLEDETCTSFGAWNLLADVSTLTRQFNAPIANGECRKYKWTVKNLFDVEHTFNPNLTVMVDQTPPTFTYTENLIGTSLELEINAIDKLSGVASYAYNLNNGGVVGTSSTPSLALLENSNLIRLIVKDKAGNETFKEFFTSADAQPPQIIIHSIEEGETYGDNLTLDYATTHQLSDITITVNGSVVTDLSGLADGTHTLVITGTASDGSTVSTTVNFVKDSTLFSVVLLSPQERTYAEKNITVDINANQPLVNTEIELDGVLQGSPNLTNLTDGAHILIVRGTNGLGETKTITRNFTVETVLPQLVVNAPSDGSILQSKTFQVNFTSDSPVTYTLESATGPISNGSQLTVTNDLQSYNLVLTATHSSGTTISESINFSVDASDLNLDLMSPSSILYATKTIPITYDLNKVASVTTFLDGNPVTALENLAAGDYSFKAVATDSAGRTKEQTVNFTIAELEIISPTQDQELIDNNFPPLVNVEYASSGFNFITGQLDDKDPVLLPNASGTHQFQTLPGFHELFVTGNQQGFKLTKTVDFRIGAKNIKVNATSIDYESENCDDNLVCDVDVTLTIYNTGEYDVAEDIPVRFSHLSGPSVLAELDFVIPGLAKDATYTYNVSTFQAQLEDTFVVEIDRDKTIASEDTRDNQRQTKFQAAKIIDLKYNLARFNNYYHGVHVLDTLSIATVGSVSYVEFDVNGKIFVDDEKTRNTFSSVVDLAYLSPETNYISINLYSRQGKLLDTKKRFYDVINYATPYAKFLFDWTVFSPGTKVNMRDVTNKKLVQEKLEAESRGIRDSTDAIFSVIKGKSRKNKLIVNYYFYENGSNVLRAKERNQNAVAALNQGLIDKGTCIGTNSAMLFSTNMVPAIINGMKAAITTEINNSFDDRERNMNDQLSNAFDKIEEITSEYAGAFYQDSSNIQAAVVHSIDWRFTAPTINLTFAFGAPISTTDPNTGTVSNCRTITENGIQYKESELNMDIRWSSNVIYTVNSTGAQEILNVDGDGFFAGILFLRGDNQDSPTLPLGPLVGYSWGDSSVNTRPNVRFNGIMYQYGYYQGTNKARDGAVPAQSTLTFDKVRVATNVKINNNGRKTRRLVASGRGDQNALSLFYILPIFQSSNIRFRSYIDIKSDFTIDSVNDGPITSTITGSTSGPTTPTVNAFNVDNTSCSGSLKIQSINKITATSKVWFIEVDETKETIKETLHKIDEDNPPPVEEGEPPTCPKWNDNSWPL